MGWSPAFISSCYPRASRNLKAKFVRDIRKLSIGLVPGTKALSKNPGVFTQEITDLRLDGLLILVAMTFGRLGDPFLLLKYPEQLQGPKREFNAEMDTASYRKLKDWRTLLL